MPNDAAAVAAAAITHLADIQLRNSPRFHQDSLSLANIATESPVEI